jgi:plastocyanin
MLMVAIIVAAGGVSAALAGTRADAATPPKVPTTVVKVVETEYNFALSTHTVRAGWVIFKATNKGTVAHDFFIYGINKGTAQIDPGQSTTFKVRLKKGSYHYVCTVGEHAIRGMQGQLTVK